MELSWTGPYRDGLVQAPISKTVPVWRVFSPPLFRWSARKGFRRCIEMEEFTFGSIFAGCGCWLFRILFEFYRFVRSLLLDYVRIRMNNHLIENNSWRIYDFLRKFLHYLIKHLNKIFFKTVPFFFPENFTLNIREMTKLVINSTMTFNKSLLIEKKFFFQCIIQFSTKMLEPSCT